MIGTLLNLSPEIRMRRVKSKQKFWNDIFEKIDSLSALSSAAFRQEYP